MTIQIAVRLPDPVVNFLDAEVAAGRASSRAAMVSSALEREMRRILAERDVEILQRVGSGDDLDGLVRWAVENVENVD